MTAAHGLGTGAPTAVPAGGVAGGAAEALAAPVQAPGEAEAGAPLPRPELTVVGAGPVGLVAGLAAVAAGFSVQLLERAEVRRLQSRAIGIHPPLLARLHRIDPELVAAMLEEGTRVVRGRAWRGPGRPLGTLEFGTLGGRWPFILTLPQSRTEALLEEALERRAPGALRRGVEADPWACLARGGRGGEVRKGPPEALVLAADGKGSRFREALGLDFPGGPYPSRYIMGDFRVGDLSPDDEGEAGIWIHREGLVESFPLHPQGLRRWVAEVEPSAPRDGGGVEGLVDRVRTRAGQRLAVEGCAWFSPFGVERRRVAAPWTGRVILLGDAAHLVSPIGGQGMNLGWLHAMEAVEAAVRVFREGAPMAEVRDAYNRKVLRRTREATRRAEWNMWLGGRGGLHRTRVTLVRALLATPARRALARRFTMHGMEGGA